MLPLMTQAADQLSYSYLDPAYITTDIDGFDDNVDGFALRGSLEVTDQFFGWAGYTTQSTEVFGEDLDYTTMSIDPSDDCTFWYANEYYTLAGQLSSTAGWQTRIANFRLPTC